VEELLAMSDLLTWPKAMKGVGRELSPQQQLACLLRITAAEGWTENVGGHITVVQEGTDNFWVNPWGIWWEEVCASDIIVVDRDGHAIEGRWDVTPAINIHTEIHRRRADAKVLVHNHPYYATLLGILGEAPRLLHQNFAAFAGDIALVDEYSGVVNSIEEGEAFADHVGDASAVLLRNHGAIIVAPTVEEAAWKAALFERMCHMTYDALISERHARELDPAQLGAIKAQLHQNCPQYYWDGACRRLIAAEPDVLD
jgi:ribulose-5-phosphate 4-epimerase/fuculose-1-phosphate aldolase